MKKSNPILLYIIIGFLFKSTVVFSQDVFQRTYDSLFTQAWDISRASDNNFLLTGFTDAGILYMKINSNGSLENSMRYDGLLLSTGNKILQTHDKGNIILGRTSPTFREILLIKTDSSGNLIWSKVFYLPSKDIIPNDLVLNPDGSLLILIESISPDYKTYLMKTDSLGNVLWSNSYEVNNGFLSTASLAVCANGDYVISGNYGDDMFIIRTDTFGLIRWGKIVGSTSTPDHCRNVVEMSNGDLLCGGNNLCKLDSTGNLIWVKKLTLNQDLQILKMLLSTNDSILLLCNQCDSLGNCGALLVKTDNDLIPQWSIKYPSYYGELVIDFEPADENGFLILNDVQDSLPLMYIYLIKTDSLGSPGCNFLPVSVISQSILNHTIFPGFTSTIITFSDSSVNLVARNPHLNENIICLSNMVQETSSTIQVTVFPNPFGSAATLEIQGQLSFDDDLVLEIFDLTGRKLNSLNLDNSTTLIDGSNFGNGLYFFTINEDGKQLYSGKFLVHKQN